MPSTCHLPSHPATWTLEQPTSSPQARVTLNTWEYQGESKSGFTCDYQPESKDAGYKPVFQFKPVCEYQASDFKLPEVKPACDFKATDFFSSEFTVPQLNSSGLQQLSETAVKSALSMAENYIAPVAAPDAAVTRSIFKIEARFENKINGLSIWKTGTGLLLSPDLVVAGGEVVYDAEYQLGTATQPRYGQRVMFSAEWSEGYKRHSRDIAFIQVAQPPAIVAASQEWVPDGEAYYCPGCDPLLQLHRPSRASPEPVPGPITEPIAEPTVEPVPEPVAILEPEVAEPEIPVTVDETPETQVAEEPADATHPFYETMKIFHQIDNKTLDIESSLIGDIGHFVSVAAGSLVSYVVGAETISRGAATELAGVPERALLAEASLQPVLAIEQSDELDEVIASMKQNWTANADSVDQISYLLAPYLSEAAKYIVEYHEENDKTEVSPKPLHHRNLGIRQFPINESTEAFVEGLFEPTLPLSGRGNDISSLGPVLRSAVSATQQIVCQVGKSTIESQVPKLLFKYQGSDASAVDVQATRVLVQRAIMADADIFPHTYISLDIGSSRPGRIQQSGDVPCVESLICGPIIEEMTGVN
ncbi:uncharacterized protein FSUBG_13915 [Fusarium subglutinans]|uniref:Uncharacterized protein n=1 Tax=Gibberella subglutinans TaxID=42677 RepID=A0A8H5KMG3_GIBSU|nr:uncharacterized protein FSUBG_13915 [Fusarium subglutinans]KAF5575448.1 hypothetical protein FSUBG_13915 [Fusarium subglutinans]